MTKTYSSMDAETSPSQAELVRDSRREKLQELFSSTRFNVLITVLIVLNTIFMGIELDTQPPAKASETALTYLKYPEIPEWVIPVFEAAFSLIFTIEFCLKVYAFRLQLFKEWATYIDITAILPGLIEMFMKSGGVAGNLMILRIIRLMRLFRFLRLIKMCKELYVLTVSFMSACRTLVWVVILLFIFLYCSAVFCTILIGHNPLFRQDDETMMLYFEVTGIAFARDRHFGSIMRSVFTLFQVFTLDNWSLVVRPIVETHQPFMFIFFVCFIFVTTFGLLNLLVGVIVDTTVSAARNADLERERLLQDKKLQVSYVAEKIFAYVDKDGNGQLEPDEIQGFVEEAQNRDLLRENLPFEFDIDEFVEICQFISEDWFHKNDTMGRRESMAKGGVTLAEFIGAATRLQGSAQSRDVLASRVTLTSIRQQVDQIQMEYGAMPSILKEMNAKIDRLSNGESTIKIDHTTPEVPVLDPVQKNSNELRSVPGFGSGSAMRREPLSPSRIAPRLSRLATRNVHGSDSQHILGAEMPMASGVPLIVEPARLPEEFVASEASKPCHSITADQKKGPIPLRDMSFEHIPRTSSERTENQPRNNTAGCLPSSIFSEHFSQQAHYGDAPSSPLTISSVSSMPSSYLHQSKVPLSYEAAQIPPSMSSANATRQRDMPDLRRDHSHERTIARPSNGTVSHGVNQAEVAFAKEYGCRNHAVSHCYVQAQEQLRDEVAHVYEDPPIPVSAYPRCQGQSGVLSGQSLMVRNHARWHRQHGLKIDDQSQLQSQQFIRAASPPGIPAHDHNDGAFGDDAWRVVY